MAPNRKQIDVLASPIGDVAALQASIQPKFLPLTHPKEQEQHEQQQEQQQVQEEKKRSTSASYWDWPADAVVQEEERCVNLFSVSRIEANLVKAAANNAEEEKVATTVAEHDDYWAEESSSQEEPVSTTQPQHVVAANDSYWTWNSTPSAQDEKQAIIDDILAEDKAGRIVSASLSNPTMITSDPQQMVTSRASNDSYWAWSSPVMATHYMDKSHPMTNYWDWDSTPRDEKDDTIQQLKEYEAARVMLAVDHVVENLQKVVIAETAPATDANNDDYWNMSEPLGDAYWDMPATHPVACGGKGYWDW